MPRSELKSAEERLAAYPLSLIVRLDGRAFPAFMANATGLSRNRFRRDRPTSAPGHVARIRKGLRETLTKTLARAKYSSHVIDHYLDGWPEGPFEGFLYGLNPPHAPRTPLSRSVARRIDRLIGALEREAAIDNLAAYKQRVISWTKRRPEYWTLEGSQDPVAGRAAIHAAADWGEMSHAMGLLVTNIISDFLSALDLEYTSAAFGTKFRRIPLFLALLPRPGGRVDPSGFRPRQRGAQPVVITSTRRLIELAYAICYRFAKGRWPEHPPRPEDLQVAIGVDEATLGKRFVGLRPYTVRTWNADWIRLHDHFFPDRDLPVPNLNLLLIAAQQWDALFVGHEHGTRKIRALFWTQYPDYWKWWNLKSEKWVSQLPEGDEDWPSWIKDFEST